MRLETLEATITSQKQDLAVLETKFKYSIDANSRDEKDFKHWAGFLLASAAVIVTGLGVIIALMSFFGYYEVLKKAETAAANKADETASKTSIKVVEEKSKDAIQQLMEDRQFDPILTEIVEKIVYRGIGAIDIETGDTQAESQEGEGSAE